MEKNNQEVRVNVDVSADAPVRKVTLMEQEVELPKYVYYTNNINAVRRYVFRRDYTRQGKRVCVTFGRHETLEEMMKQYNYYRKVSNLIAEITQKERSLVRENEALRESRDGESSQIELTELTLQEETNEVVETNEARFDAIEEKLDRLLRTTVDVSHRMNREQKNKGLIGRLLG